MTELSDLLQELAEEQPPVRLDPTTFARGRRSRRRRLAAGSGLAAAAAMTVVAGAVGLLPTHSTRAPVDGDARPALPSHVYEVPEGLAAHGELGYTWDDSLAAADLAIGPTAVVFPVNGGAVLAVSAVHGGYHGLTLPGFDEDAYFRFENTVVALSPDGTRLAYTWNPRVVDDADSTAYVPSGVRIVDLTTGEVDSIGIRVGYGAYANGFSWSPDGRFLGYEVWATTSPNGAVSGRRSFWVERLDTSTGERTKAEGLPAGGESVAVSSAGEVLAGGQSWLPGRQPRRQVLDLPTDSWTSAWSPDGTTIATGSMGPGGTVSLAGADRHSFALAVPESFTWVRVVGWAGDDEVAVIRSVGEPGLELAAVGVDGTGVRRLAYLDGPATIKELSVATDLLGEPTRDFPEPDWPTDWGQVAWRAVQVAFGLGVLWVAFVELRALVRRRRTR